MVVQVLGPAGQWLVGVRRSRSDTPYHAVGCLEPFSIVTGLSSFLLPLINLFEFHDSSELLASGSSQADPQRAQRIGRAGTRGFSF
jgi:hypothetical protein